MDLSQLTIPEAPYLHVFGKQARALFQQERERFLKALGDLREQEKKSRVSTACVLEVLVHAWVLARRIYTLRDRELIAKLREIPQIALNYGFGYLLKSRYYVNLLESVEKLST